MDVFFELAGERAAGLRFADFPAHAREALQVRIAALTERLYGQVIGDEPNRTGALVGSTFETVREGENFISGRVAVTRDFAKAAALEYGAHHPTKVRAHEMRLGHFWARLVAPREVMVSAYTRTPNIAAHRFLRGPLDAMRGEIVAELIGALDDAVAASQ